MEAFEGARGKKWLCDFDADSGRFTCDDDCKFITCDECRSIRAKGWRAALEWAKTQEDYTRYDCIPLTLIEKELETEE